MITWKEAFGLAFIVFGIGCTIFVLYSINTIDVSKLALIEPLGICFIGSGALMISSEKKEAKKNSGDRAFQ